VISSLALTLGLALIFSKLLPSPSLPPASYRCTLHGAISRPRRTYMSRGTRCEATAAEPTPAEAPISYPARPTKEAPLVADPEASLLYRPMTPLESFWASFRLAFALPWRRFKGGAALAFKLGGSVAELPQSRFSSNASLPALCDCLLKAAHDPRVNGIVMKIDPLQCGWAKLKELRRHVAAFRASGKWAVAYLERAGEKEYYLASAFGEVYAPPPASISLRGVAATGAFLRGVLDKVRTRH
jgi:hypothetical protein